MTRALCWRKSMMDGGDEILAQRLHAPGWHTGFLPIQLPCHHRVAVASPTDTARFFLSNGPWTSSSPSSWAARSILYGVAGGPRHAYYSPEQSLVFRDLVRPHAPGAENHATNLAPACPRYSVQSAVIVGVNERDAEA